MPSAVFDAICDIKPRLFGPGRVANPRDTTRYRCGLRLAQTKNPSVLFVPSSIKHYIKKTMHFFQSLPIPLQTTLLLVASNVFMTFAWYGHLKNLATSPWYVAALASWGIALFEYLLQVPANRIGFTQFDVGQLKIIQEVITLSVFVPFAVFYLGQPLKWDYLWAGLCMVGAVYFVFRSA